ncbi:hypothetical protein GH714_003598 [Hevea brasiliensis]|uniref:PHP n=1 Tax=Hevea brasiliensis TaxID=3981 RepID=A0A6A6KBN9_HEVBR|nr:hypothetical protein GH714_003598 [Hevea brasiliensis]
MDPLSALRDFTIRGEVDKIVRVNEEFRFGTDYTFPCSIKTAYRSKHGNLYTLETLVYYIQNANLKFTDYLQNARAVGLTPITFIDRKPLFDYLTGKLSSTDSIVYPLPQQQQQHQQNPNADLANEYRPDDPAFLDSHDADVAGADNGKEEDPITMIYSMERPLKDRESLLECKNRDFYSVLVASTRLKRRGRESNPSRGRMGWWLREFLEDGIYIPTDVKVKQMKGAKPDCVTVQKKFSTDRNRVMTAYEVRDKPSALKAEDWDRVVAVFVLGKEWQFKDWPFKDHVEIFNKIIGFFIRFEDDSVESAKTVKQWNVKIISISKNKRHQDRAAALEVWDRLEEFVRSRSHS